MAVAARDGTLRRNFQGYTVDTGVALVGLGASAISRFPQGYAQNQPGTGDYAKAVQSGAFATKRGHAFTRDDLIRGRLIEQLMCRFQTDRVELQQDYGASPAMLDALFDDVEAEFGAYVRRVPSGLEIPHEGRPLARMIARAFDAYELDRAGHSPAI
jgi:oxygen-independent coproporphyrinogen-3 oxidase